MFKAAFNKAEQPWLFVDVYKLSVQLQPVLGGLLRVFANFLPQPKWRTVRITFVTVCLFVCVEVLRPSQPNGSCRARSVYLTTRLLGRLSPLSG